MMARKASEFSLRNVDLSLIWKQMDKWNISLLEGRRWFCRIRRHRPKIQSGGAAASEDINFSHSISVLLPGREEEVKRKKEIYHVASSSPAL